MAFTYSLLASTTVGAGGASSIDFTNIPQNYTDLVVKISGRTNSSGNESVALQFNGDTANNYRYRRLYGTGSAAGSDNSTSYPYALIGYITGNTDTSNTFGSVDAYIPNYTSSNQKSISGDGVGENNATTAYSAMVASLWTGTNAITSIKILMLNGTSFNQYSTATLYGIRATEY